VQWSNDGKIGGGTLNAQRGDEANMPGPPDPTAFATMQILLSSTVPARVCVSCVAHGDRGVTKEREVVLVVGVGLLQERNHQCQPSERMVV